MFEQHGAFEVAAGVYGDFAKFAAGVKPLAQSASDGASTAETASSLAAAALDSRAAKALAKTMADRKPDEPPPAKLSDEYAAAIAAQKAFLAAYPKSVLSSDGLRKITAVAVQYAQIDAWDVAEGVYTDLAKSDLKIRRPERLEFARGLCQLGRAMPAHAREILTALNSAGLSEDTSEPVPEELAMIMGSGVALHSEGELGGGMGFGPGGGRGGMGGGGGGMGGGGRGGRGAGKSAGDKKEDKSEGSLGFDFNNGRDLGDVGKDGKPDAKKPADVAGANAKPSEDPFGATGHSSGKSRRRFRKPSRPGRTRSNWR